LIISIYGKPNQYNVQLYSYNIISWRVLPVSNWGTWCIYFSWRYSSYRVTGSRRSTSF